MSTTDGRRTACKLCDRVGTGYVECTTCGRTKCPQGRDAGLEASSGFCNYDCEGYEQDPRPGFLWPGERWGDSFGCMDWHKHEGGNDDDT